MAGFSSRLEPDPAASVRSSAGRVQATGRAGRVAGSSFNPAAAARNGKVPAPLVRPDGRGHQCVNWTAAVWALGIPSPFRVAAPSRRMGDR